MVQMASTRFVPSQVSYGLSRYPDSWLDDVPTEEPRKKEMKARPEMPKLKKTQAPKAEVVFDDFDELV